MLHQIGEGEYQCAFFPNKEESSEDVILVLQDDKLWLKKEGDGFSLPRRRDFFRTPLLPGATRYLFSVHRTSFFLSEPLKERPESFSLEGTFALRQKLVPWEAFGGVTAYHLGYWYHHNRFCGACGEKMEFSGKERALVCPACGNIKYPEISPAVIVGITHQNRLLLTRYAGRTTGGYALVAGFCEIGESFEDTIKREVAEEVGLKVKNITYYQSQPWGFSRSLLAGFFAEVDGDPTVTLVDGELSEGTWFEREAIPPITSDMSLTSTMMDAFRKGEV